MLVWRVSTAVSPAAIEALEPLLDEHERTRAARFGVAAARERFVVGRAVAKTALGQMLGRDPRELRFALRCAVCGLEDHGKPYLTGHAGEVDFSISHSGGVALVAVGRGLAVGADVELVRESTDVDALALRVLSPEERAPLAGLSGAERRVAFFRSWTRKEAYLKGRGTGLAGGLDRWTISPDGRVSSSAAADRSEAARWCVRSLEVGAGYLAAVAADDPFDAQVEPLGLDHVIAPHG